MDTSYTTSDKDPQNDRLNEIRSKMKVKRKAAARLAAMNGSWDKSFGKKRRCPNASVILKSSLKSNNRALAKSLQNLKQENRMGQDMIIDLQHEQQMLMQKVCQMKQNDKENLRIRKEIQTALNDVTSSLLSAGTKLAYAMELTTSFPIRESLLRSSSVAMSTSDDDSPYSRHRPSSVVGPSVYYRKSKSAVGLTPVAPADEASQQTSNSHPLPSPVPFPTTEVSHEPMDDAVMESNEGIHQDPMTECLDPSMINELDFDMPLMFTDDDLGVTKDVTKSDDDSHPIKRRTRSSRTSGLIDLASIKAAPNTNSTSSRCINKPSAATQSRATFVIDQDIKEVPESKESQLSSATQEEANQPSNILNQTFEVDDKSVEKSVEEEKTTHQVVDMELTETNEQSSELPVENKPGKSQEASDKVMASNVSKKKSKLPMKKAKTKVSLKKKDMQEIFQSPKSPLVSPGISRSTMGLSFRCVPSPVFGKTAKREPVLSNSQVKDKANMSVTSVFDLSEGDTFTEARSVLLPPSHEPVILECSDADKMQVDEDDLTTEKKNEENLEKQQADDDKPRKLKQSKEKRKTFRVKDNKMATNSSSSQQVHTIDNVEAKTCIQDERKCKKDNGKPVATKIRKSIKSKSIAASKGKTKKTQHQESDDITNDLVAASNETDAKTTPADKVDTNNHKKGGGKKSPYFPFKEQEDDASLVFFTKPMLHKKKKDDKGNTSGEKEDDEESGSKNSTQTATNEISDFLKDIDMILDQEKGKRGKKKKKRSSIPILQNKSVMASRLDALMMPSKDTPGSSHSNQPEQTSDKIGTHSEINKPEQSSDKVSKNSEVDKTKQGSDKMGGEISEPDQGSGEVNSHSERKEEQHIDRSRHSSSSPEIQPVAKGRKRRCIISNDDSSGEEYRPAKKKFTAKEKKRVSFDHKVSDYVSKTGKQKSKEQSDEDSADEEYKPTKQKKKSTAKEKTRVSKKQSDEDSADEEYKPTKQKKKLSTAKERKRVSFDQKVSDYVSETDRQKSKEQSDEDSADEEYKPTKQKKKSSAAKERKRVSKKQKQGITEKHEKASVQDQLPNLTKIEQNKVQTVEKNEVQSIKDTVQESDEDASVEIVENRRLKTCIQKRSSQSQSKAELDRNSVGSTSVAEKADPEQRGSLGGQRRTSRRAAGAVSYKEPSLSSKMRRGDTHQSVKNEYLSESDIYKAQDGNKNTKKKGEKRRPLSSVQNTIVKEEMACEQGD
ncbi:uncharacterized protein [Amphiura filiformis]|uniref:uncharacterized protein n=1 Tax=Amphiura filiformis TaxID=82378 RepID=UPI003B21BC09